HEDLCGYPRSHHWKVPPSRSSFPNSGCPASAEFLRLESQSTTNPHGQRVRKKLNQMPDRYVNSRCASCPVLEELIRYQWVPESSLAETEPMMRLVRQSVGLPGRGRRTVAFSEQIQITDEGRGSTHYLHHPQRCFPSVHEGVDSVHRL